jgi:hypothetical protein
MILDHRGEPVEPVPAPRAAFGFIPSAPVAPTAPAGPADILPDAIANAEVYED